MRHGWYNNHVQAPHPRPIVGEVDHAFQHEVTIMIAKPGDTGIGDPRTVSIDNDVASKLIADLHHPVWRSIMHASMDPFREDYRTLVPIFFAEPVNDDLVLAHLRKELGLN